VNSGVIGAAAGKRPRATAGGQYQTIKRDFAAIGEPGETLFRVELGNTRIDHHIYARFLVERRRPQEETI
jgi:hypothetical protein